MVLNAFLGLPQVAHNPALQTPSLEACDNARHNVTRV